MDDFFEDLYNEGDEEPSFSLSEFKKWLSKQNKEEKQSKKDNLKEKFNKRFKEKIKKNREQSQD